MHLMISTFAGVISSLLGMGGGEIMIPTLLYLKFLPQTASVTVSLMSLLTTSSSLVHYVILGGFPYSYGVAVFIIGAVGGISGRFAAYKISRTYNRPSLLVLILVCVQLLSFMMFTYYLSIDQIDFDLNSYC